VSLPAVLITSASRGLGLEFTAQYVADNWHVYAACRHPDSAAKLQRLAQDHESRIDILAMDVTNASSIERATVSVQNAAIDVLINSAGIIGEPNQKAGKVDYPAWAHVLDVNTMGPLRVTEAFVDHIARSQRRLVVTISSGMGSLADNTSGGSIPYRSSKAAVNMVMRSAAIDLAPRGINCVLINPGWVQTDMGGRSATLTPRQSVTAMRLLIEGLGANDSGKFYNYDGREYAW
jgi:NAD(P)-dependent dehydrogenase (short-subunit alcohol dehydrogenase family)